MSAKPEKHAFEPSTRRQPVSESKPSIYRDLMREDSQPPPFSPAVWKLLLSYQLDLICIKINLVTARIEPAAKFRLQVAQEIIK
ncbi:hypothetical protein [Lacunimicrobium album]